MATMRVPTEFTAVDKFTAVVQRMASSVDKFGKTTNAALSRVNKKFDSMLGLTSAVKSALAGISVALLLTTAINSVKDYEVALHSLEAVTGQASSKFTEQIEQLAKHNKKSAIDVAGSFEVIGSAMSQYLDNPEALAKITQAGITLAKASRQELTPTLQNLTSVMNQFKLGAEDADRVINQLTAGEIVGSVSTAKIAEGLQEFGANAYGANVKLSESVALLETLGKQMDHSKIAVGARNILGVLSSAKGLPKEAIESLRKHGVNTTLLMDKNKSLGERLTELSKIQNDAVAVTKVFGKENMTAANVIFQNIGTYSKWEEEIRKTNKAQEQARVNSDTLSTKIDELKASFINIIVSSDDSNLALGRVKDTLSLLADNMDTVVEVGAGVLLFYGSLKAAALITSVWTFLSAVAMGVMGAASGVASVGIGSSSVAMASYNITAAIMTGVTWLMNTALWSTAAAVLAATWPILAIIAAVLLVVYIFLYWDEICTWFGEQWEKFTSWIGDMWDNLVEWFQNFSFADFFKNIGKAIIDWMLLPLRGVLKLLSYLPGKVGDMAQNALDSVNDMTGKMGISLVGESKLAEDAAATKEKKKLESPQEVNYNMQKENRMKGQIDLNVNDKGGNIGSTQTSGFGGIPVNVTPTQGAFGF